MKITRLFDKIFHEEKRSMFKQSDILDEKNNSVENHKLLNDFDSRSLEELKFPVFLLWASENIGIWSARLLLLVHKCLNKLKIFNH